VSYSDDDRQRVMPLVQRFRRRRWSVWWDRDNRIGDKWRDLIADRLQHARCVVVVWTHRSVKSRYVQDEAEEGANRGVLMPVRLDAVTPPIGFGGFQYADLAGWTGGRSLELNRLTKRIGTLLAGAVEVKPWLSVENDVMSSGYGATEAQRFVSEVRAQADMFKRNPAAADALREALVGVGQTYDAVSEAIGQFDAPLDSGRKLTSARYRPLATGRLKADIEAKRGHCTQIGQSYIGEGGLRDSLPPGTDPAVVEELDRIFLRLSRADGDLFSAMGAVGDGLEKESGIVANMLLAGQNGAARKRLEQAEETLRPLVRQLNDGKRELNRLAGELGLVM
jgi:hypothetical protein